MLQIKTTKETEQLVNEIILSQNRLNELVFVNNSSVYDLEVGENITSFPDWKNMLPPVLFPLTKFTKDSLLGILYTRLGNYEKAYELLKNNPEVFECSDSINRLQHGIAFKDLHPDTDYLHLHNNSIIQHYGFVENADYENLQKIYDQALEAAPADEFKAFTALHYAQWLNDFGFTQMAEDVLEQAMQLGIHEYGNIQLLNTWCSVQIKKLKVPYDQQLLVSLKDNLWKCLNYYENNNYKVETALIINDAAHIAAISNSFSEALGYSNRAISLLEDEDLPQLKAQAQLTKANLLMMWAQNGNPQFYKQAVQEYQQALKVFTRDYAPDIFANIQHQLGTIYAEIPDDTKKKSVWAAVSVSSFNEALQFYNKIDYPYEFASICHSLGNAYTKYPAALHSDNFDKALAWYREALDIRTASDYPFERVLTLCNYLEASWFTGNKEDLDEERYEDMYSVANEILQLTLDSEIISHTKSDLEKLQTVKKGIVV